MSLPFSKSALLVLSAALLLSSCSKEDSGPKPTQEPRLRPLTGAEVKTVASANDFAFRSFTALRGAQPADNMCVSPLSVSAALTMAYNGADGSTKQAMKQTLGFSPLTDTEINESYKSLFALLTGMDDRVTFTAANSIWHGQQYQLAAPFVQQNQDYFNASVQGLTFGAPAAASTINSWVNAKTQGKITSIVQGTSADDVLYLINALYFKGSWTYRFDPQQTQPAPFQREDGTTTNVNMMRLPNGKYRRYTDAQQQVIDLPYGSGQFSMTLIVPQGQHTLADVAGSLTAPQLSSWLAAADTSRLELQLPRFRLEYEKNLNVMLTQLGMGEAFSGQANFSRLLAGGASGLAISEVKHKTYLDVNEEGTEAAAVTSVGVVVTSLPQVVQVNRPFLFLIREKSSNAILFMGQLTNP